MSVRQEDLEGAGHPPRLSRPVEALAVLVAAGRSTRLPGDLPKQLLPLAGRPVVVWAAGALCAAAGVVGILPVHPPGMGRELEEALASLESDKILPGVPGGASRQESVACGVRALPGGAEIVLVHDAVRPLVSPALVERVLEAAALHGAAAPVLPLHETVKEVAGRSVLRTLDRTRLVVAQTPQGFHREVLLRAIAKGEEEGIRATDEAMLVERLGVPVATVEGEARNLKVTVPEDLALAEFHLQELGRSI